jgi:negative modulator of initiation of replication
MKTLPIENDVFDLLANRSLQLGRTASDLLREWLAGAPTSLGANALVSDTELDPLVAFMRSPQFKSIPRAVDQYLQVLGWLNKHHAGKFPQVATELPMGGRKYFAYSQQEITGKGYTGPRPIPNSSLWALTAMANDHKKRVLGHVLSFLGYSADLVALILAEFPDSEKR